MFLALFFFLLAIKQKFGITEDYSPKNAGEIYTIFLENGEVKLH